MKDNLNAVITGGASGLGAATAEIVIQNGGKATILDIQEDIGNKTAHNLGENCKFIKLDITNEHSVQECYKRISEENGQVSLSINCAGVGSPNKVLTKEGPSSLSDYSKIISINLIGTFNCIKAAANVMQNNNPNDDGTRGVIINTASIAAYDGQIGQAAYSASKGGVVGMTLPIARELARYGIRVNTIAPGLFETPMLGSLPDEAKANLINSTLHPHRLGQPIEYASLVMHIFENEMLNGETIRLDGSLRMAPK